MNPEEAFEAAAEVARLQRHSVRVTDPAPQLERIGLATIGRAAAVAQIRKIHISGYFAWLAWLFIHIMFLIGFRNRLIVMIQWAWSYFTYERGARLITGDIEKITPKVSQPRP